jgi:hypothetical protein
MAKAHSNTLVCRQELFREQVVRFSRCERRVPSRLELRQLWRATGFPIA